MNEVGEIILGAIALIFIAYTLIKCFIDATYKECSVVRFSGSFIAFIYIVNKFWEVV